MIEKILYLNERSKLIILTLGLLIGIFVRYYGIDSPVADWHSFRQVDTLSVTINYIDDGINLLVPKYHDISTIQSGIFNPEGYRFVEFPLYNAVTVLVYSLFKDINIEVFSRIFSIYLSIITALGLYFLGGRFSGTTVGLLASFFYLFLPFNIYFTRVILPEPLAASLGVWGLCFFVLWIDKNKKVWLYSSALIFSLALLVKPFTVFYLIPAAYLVFNKDFSLKVSYFDYLIRTYFLFTLIVILPFILWRYWESYYPEGIPYLKWIFNGDGIRFRPSFWRWLFGERLGYLILGTWGLIPFAFGLIKKSKSYFIHYFGLGMLVYLSVVATANVRHDYYQTLIIPSVCLILSVGSVYLFKKSFFAKLLLLFSILIMIMVGLTKVREYYKIDHPEIIEAGYATQMLTQKNDLVIAPYNGDTAFLYQTGRKGWPYVDRPLNEMIDIGAKYYISVNFDAQTNEFITKYPALINNGKYVLLELHTQ